jgi:hypothetical protein
LKTVLIISSALTFLISNVVFSQDTVQIKIDNSFCVGSSQIEGDFGFYGTTFDRNGQLVDTLIKPLQFIENQEIILNSAKFLTNFRLEYIPWDTLLNKVQAPLYYFDMTDKIINLNCYFFRKPISLLDNMNNGDTLFITKEYRGVSHAGMIFPRSTLRIVKKKKLLYYSRNDLPTRGDGVILTFPEGRYENGFSEDSELTEEQIFAIKKFETEVVKSTAYSLEYGMSEIRITLKGKTYKFISDMRIRNEKAYLIWEKLK